MPLDEPYQDVPGTTIFADDQARRGLSSEFHLTVDIVSSTSLQRVER